MRISDWSSDVCSSDLLLVALGPVVARVGMTSMIVLVVTADLQVPIVHAPAVATLIFAGGVLQMLMAVAAWPLQRYRPERFALATVMQQLAEVARSRPDASPPPPVSMEAMDALETLHGEYRSPGRAMQSFRLTAELSAIGRASCRERVFHYVTISVGADYL